MSETTSDSGQPVPEAPVERYTAGHDTHGSKVPMSKSTDGDWVRYEDYEKLLRWKQEQMAVIPDWQEIGREMGLTLGDSVHDKILPWIREAKALVQDKDMEIQFLTDEISRIEYHGTSET